MIDNINLFDQPVNSMSKIYENRKIATGQRDDSTIILIPKKITK